MTQQYNNARQITMVRELASQYSTQTLDACIQSQLDSGENDCFFEEDVDNIMNVLAKASFVKAQMINGLQLSQAMRVLGQRMRALQGT